MQIPDIKNRLSITKVLAHYNIKPDKNNHIKCPFHQDDKPSCKIYLETNTFHCFGCGATGDQIEFCVKMEGDKHKGILKATELAGENTGTIMSGDVQCQAANEETDFETSPLVCGSQTRSSDQPKCSSYRVINLKESIPVS